MAVVARRELLEREAVLEVLSAALAEVDAGTGRLLFVAGESGVGKTAVVRAFADSVPQPVRWGACDPLSTPVPLAPFADVASNAGDALRSVLAQPCTAHEVFGALRDDAAGETSVLVIEDAHWADEATLDVLRILGRRITAMPLLAIVTHRDGPAAQGDSLRVALGDLAGADGVSRVAVEPLSRAAVGILARGHAVDLDELHRRTAGNPFYVSEVLAAGGDAVPPTVRDAVIARCSRLDDDTRGVLDVIACSPQPTETWLLDALVPARAAAVAAALDAGMLVEVDAAIAYRHEIAREAVADAMPAARRTDLHGRILRALAATTADIDPARLAHHAELAGQAHAAVRFATAAAARAAAVGAHRQAAAQYGRALRFAEGATPAARADLLEQRATALYAADDQLASILDLRAAIELHRSTGDIGREADATALLVPRLLCRGYVDEAQEAAERALELVAGPDLPQQAGALGALAHLYLVVDRLEDTIEVGERAIAAADRFGADEAGCDAEITVGLAHAMRGDPSGPERLASALERAQAQQLDALVPRAFNGLAYAAVASRDAAAANRWIAEGLAYVDGHELDLWRLSILSIRLRAELDQGRWSDATETGRELLEDERDSPEPSAEALAVLALVRARRGDPAPAGALAEAAEIFSDPGWTISIACAEAEVAWLDGRPRDIGPTTDAAYAIAATRESSWPFALLALWRHRAGIAVPRDRPLPEPVALELDGRAEEAAAAWDRLGSPYEAAVALCLAEDPDAIAEAHSRLRAMGAAAATKIAAQRLRERGVRGIARGPRPSTLNNAALLTNREQSVLALVAEGLSNAQVAARLFVSRAHGRLPRSAILRKLDVRSRGEAVATARRLGLLEDP